MDLLFGYGAGLLTLINPCVLPVLPLIIAAALRADKFAPLAMAGGLSVSFVVLGVSVAALGPSLGIDERHISATAAIIMIAFGVILLVPQVNEKFALATAGVSSRADQQLGVIDQSSSKGHFFGGMLLGAVWSPCIGPTLGGAISLASQGQSLGWAALIMLSFALGVSTIIVSLAYGTQETIKKRQESFRKIAEKSKWILSAALIGVGLMILFNVHKMIEIWLLDIMPVWLQDLSVSL